MFTVYQVVPNSPASEAGIRRGDIVKNFNGLPATFFTLSDLTSKLQGRVGKKIRLKLDREGEGTMKVDFRLREII